MNNQVGTTQPKFSVVLQSDKVKNLINNTLQDKDRARRFVTAITSAVATNPTLQECDNGSIIACALLGEALDFSPSPVIGDYYLVPYNRKRQDGSIVKEAQFQIGLTI